MTQKEKVTFFIQILDVRRRAVHVTVVFNYKVV